MTMPIMFEKSETCGGELFLLRHEAYRVNDHSGDVGRRRRRRPVSSSHQDVSSMCSAMLPWIVAHVITTSLLHNPKMAVT